MAEGAFCLEFSAEVDIGKDNSSRTELKRGRQFLMNNSGPENIPNKKQAKEVSNDDVKSEVLNPAISPKENASSCEDITSQPTELAACNQVVSGDITSACSSDLCPSDTLSDEREDNSENNDSQIDSSRNGTSDSVSTSRVVLEIPKHASTSGIRKITFKLSKRKDDSQSITSVVSPAGIGTGPQLSYSNRMVYSGWVDPAIEMIQGIEDANNGIEDGIIGGDRHPCAYNMELKMSKKVVPSNYPTNVEKLLSTGILDGARVKYFSPEQELDGIVEGGGYLCGCSACSFSKVLTAYEFEQHAGVKTRHPNNHIFLENGRPICSIIQELKNAPSNSVDEVIKDAAGSAINDERFQVWKARLFEPYRCYRRQHSVPHSHRSFEQGSEDNCYISSSLFMYNNHPSFRHQNHMETSGEHKRPLKRTISLVNQKKTNDGGAKRRDNNLHRSLFTSKGLPDGTELAYSVKGQKLLAGYKQGNGIVCSCCDREISPSQFEAHAGMAARRQPYRHICTTNGLTLHDIAISIANGQGITTGVSDDMCSYCGVGSDLIFCVDCPRAFHPACLDLLCSPQGPWQCPDCIKSRNGGNLARSIVIQSPCISKSPENEIVRCCICRDHNIRSKAFVDQTVIICEQCERDFHVCCLHESGSCDLTGIPKGGWFCSDDCNKIYVALQNSVSSGVQTIPSQQMNIILRKHAERGLNIEGSTDDFQWRILRGKGHSRDDNPLLSAACAIFRECFDPIVAQSGLDLIPIMVNGRNTTEQEFEGMYLIVLLVRNVVVTAGALRIFGREVAELPLVATSKAHQRKGYFQALFSCIERFLYKLNVVNLVLPAAEEAESIWTERFGFRKMSEAEVSKYTTDLPLTVFQGTSMLQKAVPHIIE